MNLKNDALISVIVPVHNAEKYINYCIASIKNQSFSNIELILVDDCSTDNTRNIIESNIKDNVRLNNIIYLKNKKNMGAGYSRNRGLDVANGKYLVFLDADDFFCVDMIEKLYLKAEETCADIVICNCYLFDDNSKHSKKYDITWKCPDIYNHIFKLEDIKEFAFQYIHEIAWNKMFRHEFIKKNKIRFQNQFNANDQFFVFASTLVAKRIVKIDEYLLYYRTGTENQLSKSISQNPQCIWNATKATLDYINKLNLYSLYKKSFNSYAINRLMFSLERLEKTEQINLLKFYQDKGFKSLNLLDVTSDDFLIPYFYAKYKYLINYPQGININEPYVRELCWDNIKFEKLFLKLKEKNKLILWGIGDNGKKFLEKASSCGLLFKGLIDKDKKKYGKVINDYKINSKSSIENGDFIIVLNPEHIITIRHDIMLEKKKVQILDARAFLCFEIEFEEALVK